MSCTRRLARLALMVMGMAAATACVPPRAIPLNGMPTTMHLPEGALAPTPEKLIFRWHYRDEDMEAVGDGSARIEPPDSVRLDFVVDHGMGGGYALLLGDSLVAPGAGGFKRFLPSTPLLWAAMGRLAVPPEPDTIVRLDGDTLRADIGAQAAAAAQARGEKERSIWRVAFVAGKLVGLARLSGGRVREFVTHSRGGTDLKAAGVGGVAGGVGSGEEIRYDALVGRRMLTLTRVQRDEVQGFDADIWHRRR